jgi:hypothetical protein
MDDSLDLLKFDDLVKSSSYFVVGFFCSFTTLYLESGETSTQHSVSYIELFPEPSENYKNILYDAVKLRESSV